MNAYELADIVDKWAYSESAEYLTDAANMLRQQADRIAELEKLLEQSIGSDCREMRYIQEIENRDARIEELEKDGKVCATCGGLVYDPVLKQTKPLSDDEITKIADLFQIDVYSLIMSTKCIEERHGIK